MSVVEGQVFLQMALVFGLIGLLGLVLRWTFRRDTAERPRGRRRRSATPQPGPTGNRPEASPTSPPSGPAETDATPPGQEVTTKRPGERADYGLLAVAAEVATEEEATKVRRVLTAAGIRNTNAVAGDGRYRVLVFGHELIKARRVAGGSQGAGGGAAGSGGS